MSIALMTLAWKTDLPAGKKLVLLALCDNANDQGECYPSVQSIAIKCSMGERTVQQHVADMEGEGIVTRLMRKGRSTVYKIDPRKFRTPAESAPLSNPAPTPADSAPPPPQNSHPTPADLAPITVKEPSVEPSKNRQGARGTRLPADWVLTKSLGEWTLAEFPSWTAERLRSVAAKFKDHWLAQPGQKGSKADWLATWRNWCRREEEMNPQGKQGGNGAWFATEQGVIAKATELGLKTIAGESAFSLKQRVQQAIDNGGKPPMTVSGQRVVAAAPPDEGKASVSPENRRAALEAARGLKKKEA